MSKPLILNPGCISSLQSRSVQAVLGSGIYSNIAGTIAVGMNWLNTIDINTVAWGNTYSGIWASGFGTVPASTPSSTSTAAAALYESVNVTQISSGVYVSSFNYTKTEVSINSTCGYQFMVIQIGNDPAAGGANDALAGCYSNGINSCFTVALPLPSITLTYYLFAIVGPANYSAAPNTAPNMTDFAENASGYTYGTLGYSQTLGPNFDPTQICGPSDPFGGAP